MKRTIIKIDEDLCNGCGLCVDGCHEGALQIIDGKARIISDLYCDGLGACIGECPVGAITLVEREAEPYDEIKVMERISPKGEATVIAHLNHLIDHNQDEYVEQGINYIKENNIDIDLSKLKNWKSKQKEIKKEKYMKGTFIGDSSCPGTKIRSFDKPDSANSLSTTSQSSELRQWPVQLHLVNPQAPYFENADVLLAADCVAYASGEFHSKLLKGKTLAILCPKLDRQQDIYVKKIASLIDNSKINSITVAIMEVPCCSGVLQLVRQALNITERKVVVNVVVVSVSGRTLKKEPV